MNSLAIQFLSGLRRLLKMRFLMIRMRKRTRMRSIKLKMWMKIRRRMRRKRRPLTRYLTSGHW